MGLQPCTRCFRHVLDAETACPFCGAAVERLPQRASRAGRFARAALFASASLAACDQGKAGDPTHAKEPARSPRIHGMVVDQSGTPVVGAMVRIVQGPRDYQATTNHAGRYALDELEPGEYSLNVSFSAPTPSGGRSGFDTKQVTVVAGQDQKLDLTLQIMDQSPAMPYGAPPRRSRLV
jgi:hypothetical protein